MLSLLLPSRGRPENITRLVDSIKTTASHPEYIELIIHLDDDDTSVYPENPDPVIAIKYLRGPRMLLSKYWNKCYQAATGPYYMQAGDDIIFRTPGWDEIIFKAFPDDKIAFVHGFDGFHETLGTHGFLHKKWVEAVGYFVPPYFSHDYNDLWLTDVANMIGRRIYVPEVLTEHMHPAFQKAPMDATYEYHYAKGEEDNVTKIYEDKLPEREADAAKLRKLL